MQCPGMGTGRTLQRQPTKYRRSFGLADWGPKSEYPYLAKILGNQPVVARDRFGWEDVLTVHYYQFSDTRNAYGRLSPFPREIRRKLLS